MVIEIAEALKAGTPVLDFLVVRLGRLCNLVYLVPWFFFLAIPHGLWDLRSPTRDGTCAPCNGNMES